MQAQEIRPDETFDLIVVGAGLGGSITSARIAQFGVNSRNGEKLKVALFEQGPYLLKGDPARGYGSPERRAKLTNLVDEVGKIGELVGGAMTHAGLIEYPVAPIDFVHHREATGVDWTWESMGPAIAEMQAMWSPYPDPEEVRTPGQQRFRKAALGMGLDVYEVGQARLNCIHCGCCNGRICKYDAKSTPLVTYIPIAEREGVRIISNSHVEKVLIEKKGSRPVATGVVYKLNGELRRALAGKVIVSCGSGATPRLLYASGYGPRGKVQGELLAENRNVGASRPLNAIVAPPVEALFDVPIKHPDIEVHSVYYVERGFGPGGYNRLILRDDFGDREGTRTWASDLALKGVAPAFGREHKRYMKNAMTQWGYIGIEIHRVQLEGAGMPVVEESPTPQAGSPDDGGEGGGTGTQPRDWWAKNQPKLFEALRTGQELAYKILKEMGATKITGHERLPERIGGGEGSACRAGATAENSVVNSDLESHDVDNLFICDQSVLPSLPSRHYAMPTAVVANHAWRRIVAKHFSRA